MSTNRNISLFVAVSIALIPLVALSQTPAEPLMMGRTIATTDKVEMGFFSLGGFRGGQIELLNALLREVKPAEIAASVFDIPADKIEIVPHIYWREATWNDWAEKTGWAKRDTSWAGPDGKFVMSAEVGRSGDLQLEFGPVPWHSSAEYLKFKQAELQILERVAAKMVREAPDFSIRFEREKLNREYDRIHQRLRELNGEIEQLRREIGGESGLSPAQLAERLADLSKQELSNRLSLDVMVARRNAIQEQIEKVKTQADAKVAENQSLRTLKRIVELRKARFENLKQQKSQGVVPQADVDKAEEEMLAAMVEVDRAAAAQQKDASQSQLDQLSAELSKLAVDQAEAEARNHFLANAVHESEAALAERRDTDAKADEIRSRLTALEHRRAQLQAHRNQAEDSLNEPIEPLKLTLPEK